MTAWHDLRDAARQLRRSPGFTAAAVLSMALGIGANTAIFTLLDQVLLRSLPIAAPDRLVRLRWDGVRLGTTLGMDTLSYPAYQWLRDRNEVFSGVLCRYALPISVAFEAPAAPSARPDQQTAGQQTPAQPGGDGSGRARQTERVAGELVSGNYFDVLGVRAAIGRTFGPEDDGVPGGHPYAILSHTYWRTRFAADPTILGRPIIVDGLPLTVVGVAERGFDGIEPGYAPRVWIPVAMKAQMTQGYFSEVVTLANARAYWVQAFARLKPGITREAAEASLQPVFHGVLDQLRREKGFEEISAESRELFLRSVMRVEPGGGGHPSLREDYGTPLLILMGIVGLVLLIACANVANLLLERAAGRQREIAVRMALGAHAWQIVRHALVESLLIAIAGGTAGLLVAAWTTDMLIGFVPTDESTLNLTSTPDWRVLGFTLLACVATGLLFGMAPALASRRVDPVPTLKQESRGIAGGARWFRAGLVIAQVGLSLLLVMGAIQFLRTLMNVRAIDSGLRTDNVLVFAVNPSLNGYDAARSTRFYRALLDRLRALPGVEAAGTSAIRVLDDNWWMDDLLVEGETRAPDRKEPNLNLVSRGYLASLGIPLLLGRDFTASDADGGRRVAIVNESFMREWVGGRNPVGRRLGLGGNPKALDIEIVGVMKDAKYTTVRKATRPQVFLDNDQNPDIQTIHVYLRTALDPQALAPVVQRTVRDLDPNVPVFAMRTMDAQNEMTMARERMVANLTAAFGVLATLLAAVGIYALMAFTVTRRTREIGVRVALGAQRGHVIWLVQRQVLVLVAMGTAVAVPIALTLSRLVQAQFYGVPPGDWIGLTSAAIALLAIAVVAGVIPARRASAIDPIRALRTE